MAVTLTAKVVFNIIADLVNGLDMSQATDALRKKLTIEFANGAGLGQAAMLFHVTRQLAASATEDLDFAGGVSNAFGAALALTKLKALIVIARDTNVNNVNVTRAAAGIPLFLAVGDGVPVKPGGIFVWVAPDAAGIAVGAGATDTLTFTNSGAGSVVDYDVIAIGS